MRFDSISGEADKPDTKELDLGSPVSPLMTRSSTAATVAGGINNGATSSTSSSSSSGGSVTAGKANNGQAVRKPENRNLNHSGDLSGLSETLRSAQISRPGHRRSISAGAPLIYSGKTISTASSNNNAYAVNASSSASSNPTSNGLPSGNILPPGKPLKTGMATRTQTRTDTLCSGTGHYGHGSIIRGGPKPGNSTKSGESNSDGNGNNIHMAPESVLIKRAMVKSDPEEVKKCANELYMRGHYSQALSLYDRAISLAPQNAAYRGNRAAALTMLGRLDEAVRECEMAVRLDSAYERGHKRLASLYLR